MATKTTTPARKITRKATSVPFHKIPGIDDAGSSLNRGKRKVTEGWFPITVNGKIVGRRYWEGNTAVLDFLGEVKTFKGMGPLHAEAGRMWTAALESHRKSSKTKAAKVTEPKKSAPKKSTPKATAPKVKTPAPKKSLKIAEPEVREFYAVKFSDGYFLRTKSTSTITFTLNFNEARDFKTYDGALKVRDYIVDNYTEEEVGRLYVVKVKIDPNNNLRTSVRRIGEQTV